MSGYSINIEEKTLSGNNFREVLHTTKRSQLVIMTLQPGEEIGSEVHRTHDQFLRVESGRGEVVIDDVPHPIEDDDAVIVPAGARHNVVNTGTTPLQLYTLYGPPEHRDGVVQATKADEFDEHFDGKTTE